MLLKKLSLEKLYKSIKKKKLFLSVKTIADLCIRVFVSPLRENLVGYLGIKYVNLHIKTNIPTTKIPRLERYNQTLFLK